MMKRHGSSSDEEGELSNEEEVLPPIPVQKNVKKTGGALWSEIVEAQNLEDEFKASGVTEESGNYINRGAESFHVPEETVFDTPAEHRSIDDNGDGNLFDETTVAEGFGVKKNAVSPGSRKRRMEASETSSNTSSRPTSRGSGVSKISNKAKKKKGLALPYMSNGFSYEKMYESEIPNDIEVEEVGRRISEVFGELDSAAISYAVKTVGIPLSLELYKETLKIEKNGGLAVENGVRRRTPGGVFFKLLKDSDKIEKCLKAKINENSRRLVEKARDEKQKQRVSNLKPLPKAPDVLLNREATTSTTAPEFDLKSEIKTLMDFD